MIITKEFIEIEKKAGETVLPSSFIQKNGMYKFNSICGNTHENNYKESWWYEFLSSQEKQQIENWLQK